MQTPYINLLADEYGQAMEIVTLPLFAHEVKGMDRLREVRKALFA